MYAKDCNFKYNGNASTNDSFSVSGLGEVILENCVVSKSAADGFKLNVSGAVTANLALINCTGRNNGLITATNSNGYSRHGPGSTIVVNGSFFGNYGPNIKDINTGTSLWCLGVNCHDPAAAAALYNFGVGDTTATAKMWLDGCKSGATVTKDLYVGPSATAYYRNMTAPTADGGGTVAPY